MTSIPDHIYHKTEGILYRYFRRLRVLHKVEAEIRELEEQVDFLREQIGGGSHLTPAPPVARYFEGVKESPSSPVEAYVLRAEERGERLMARLERLSDALFRKRLKAYEIRQEIVPVRAVLETLGEEDRTILEKRYDVPRWSYSDIGELVALSRSAVYRRVKELIAILAEALEVNSGGDHGEGDPDEHVVAV